MLGNLNRISIFRIFADDLKEHIIATLEGILLGIQQIAYTTKIILINVKGIFWMIVY